MPRIPLIENRDDIVDADQLAAFDHIISTRGKVLRPFAIALYRPPTAGALTDLGSEIRYGSILNDRDREVLTCSVAHAQRCEFEWVSHIRFAKEVGVSDATLEAIRNDTYVLDADDALLVEFALELCRTGFVNTSTFERMRERLGNEGVVEAVILIGYYTMLALLLNSFEVSS